MSAYQERLLDHALKLARAGYAAFPLRVAWDAVEGKKKISPPTGWPRISTTDEPTIRGWFGTYHRSRSALAIDTGKSGVAVIDLDVSGDKDGLAEWSRLPAQQETPMVVLTQSGGRHRFYRDPAGGRIRSTVNKVAPGIDIRAAGGLVIAPPTEVEGRPGAVYRFESGLTPVSELPELTAAMQAVVVSRQETALADFPSPTVYEKTEADGEAGVRRKLRELSDGDGVGGWRNLIYGYAACKAAFEAALAVRDGYPLDLGPLYARSAARFSLRCRGRP